MFPFIFDNEFGWLRQFWLNLHHSHRYTYSQYWLRTACENTHFVWHHFDFSLSAWGSAKILFAMAASQKMWLIPSSPNFIRAHAVCLHILMGFSEWKVGIVWCRKLPIKSYSIWSDARAKYFDVPMTTRHTEGDITRASRFYVCWTNVWTWHTFNGDCMWIQFARPQHIFIGLWRCRGSECIFGE